jgi:hypothetical protein
MDAITLTVTFKGAGMVLLIIGGIYALYKGFRLYQEGAGVGKDNIILQFGKLKATGRSVGSVVMVTAFAWGGLGVMISPNLDKQGEHIKVYSFKTPQGEVTTRSIQSGVKNAASVAGSPEMLTKVFNRTIELELKKYGELVEVNGKPAEIDAATIKITKNLAGKVLVTASARGELQSATITFEPQAERNRIVFLPSDARLILQPMIEKKKDDKEAPQ